MGENLEIIRKIVGFKITDIICRYTKYGQNFLDNGSFSFIPDLRKVSGITDIDEDNFYKIIGLTIQETEMIRNFK